MENGISVVFCSKKTKEENEDFINKIVTTCGCRANVVFVYNPQGMSLSRIYHDMLASEAVKDEIVVFIHDDIDFLRSGWGLEVMRLFRENLEYGIIGVAGSSQFDENGAWWNYSKKFGQVLHRSDGKSWLTAFSPLLDKDLEEVVVIDGLFMAIHKKRVKENFDENIEGFDFYDISMCLSNYKKCKIGVTTNIRLAHNSVGELKDSWYKNREIINKKFGNLFPIEI